MRVRLQSGVILTANETIARQYLKYGAVEVIDEIPVVEDNKAVKKNQANSFQDFLHQGSCIERGVSVGLFII